MSDSRESGGLRAPAISPAIPEVPEAVHAGVEAGVSLCGLDKVRVRLDELAKLDYGWLDGAEGLPPTHAARELCWSTLQLAMTSHGVPRPRVYPTVEGGVQAEWIVGDWGVDAWFAPSGKVMRVGASNAKTSESFNSRVATCHAEGIAAAIGRCRDHREIL